MNFSAIAIQIACRAVVRAHENEMNSLYAICEAVIFAWLAIEALLHEQAFIEQNLERRAKTVYDAIDRGGKGFNGVQAMLTYSYGRGLADGENPANDLKHLLALRNALTHYRYEEPPAKALDDLAQRGLLGKEWRDAVSWPMALTSEVARWAIETACHTANSIADLLPDDPGHLHAADLIRINFDLDAFGLDMPGAAEGGTR